MTSESKISIALAPQRPWIDRNDEYEKLVPSVKCRFPPLFSSIHSTLVSMLDKARPQLHKYTLYAFELVKKGTGLDAVSTAEGDAEMKLR